MVDCKKHGKGSKSVVHTIGRIRRCAQCNAAKCKDARQRNKIKALEYKGNVCEICGYCAYIGALDFHHVNPKNKLFALSSGGLRKPWIVVKAELDKCALLCSNCHRETHGGYHPSYLKSSSLDSNQVWI